METMVPSQHVFFLALAVFTAMCGWLVAPHTLSIYNTRWIPRWIRPAHDYLCRAYRYYYPAQEARVALAVALILAALAALMLFLHRGLLFSTDSLLLLYTVLLPAYLLHRTICFHKLNEFTPVQAAEQTNSLNVYRTWKAVLLWFLAGGVVITDLFRFLPTRWLGFFTLAMGAFVIFAYFIEINREVRENGESLRGANLLTLFREMMPGSYYLLFALLGVALTQAAFWLSMPVLLIVWVVFVAAFTVVEYHFRFVSPYRTDTSEQWGEEPYTLLYQPEEELWLIRRYDKAALRRKNVPCWVVITESSVRPGHPRVQLTANLEYKQREVELQNEKLLYIRRFDSVAQASAYAQSINASSLIADKIRQLNPTFDNLNSRSARVLGLMNTMI